MDWKREYLPGRKAVLAGDYRSCAPFHPFDLAHGVGASHLLVGAVASFSTCGRKS